MKYAGERLFAVDPGVNFHGVACAEDRGLVWLAYLPEHERLPKCTDMITTAVTEVMQVYPGGRYQKDLIDVTFAAGQFTSNLPTIKRRPGEWKKQQKKKAQHAKLFDNERRKGVLTEAEVLLLKRLLADVPKGVQHNVLDAVCLLMTELGRMGKGVCNG